MNDSSARRILRWYLRLMCALLCLTLAALGAVAAAERSHELSSGTPAAAQRELPLPIETIRLPSLPPLRTWREYLPLLPAPAGNLIGTVFAAEELFEQYLN